jgi:hypothetical protein
MRWATFYITVTVLATLHVAAVPLPGQPAGDGGGGGAAPPPPAADTACKSCYGAEDAAKGIKCCNTCDEVVRAYKEKAWAWPGEILHTGGSSWLCVWQ